jgi:predicted transcriptional regulator
MTAEQIAEDLGRSEATIRRHLTGKTEAAKLVEETYRRFASEGVKIELPALVRGSDELFRKVSELEAKLKEAEERARALEEKLVKARSLAEELVKALS